jgi:ferredoxin
VGYEVFLVEKNPYLGGRVAQLNQYFPSYARRPADWRSISGGSRTIPRIKVFTLAEVEKVDGAPGNYTVSVKINPRYVNENCTCCGACAEACQTEVSTSTTSACAKPRGPTCRSKWPFRPVSSFRRKSSAPTTPPSQGGLQIRRRRSGDAGQNRRPARGRDCLGHRLGAL